MQNEAPFFIQKDNIYMIPSLHYKLEMAAHVKLVFEWLKPDCVAVELPETLQSFMRDAASRLPDISVILTYTPHYQPLYFMSEPCDPLFEGLRSASENQVDAFCVDLDIDDYPDMLELVPDSYAIHRLGLKYYYEIYEETRQTSKIFQKSPLDLERELFMAKKLKELSLRYDKVLFIGGMSHISQILKLIEQTSFPELMPAKRESASLCTLTPESIREVLSECGYFSSHYEKWRESFFKESESTFSSIEMPDRQKMILQLYKDASYEYIKNTGNPFASYHLRNTMKFVRNYALVSGQLMPDLFKILTAAKGCVDHNYAYEVWELATEYPFLKNIDGLPELDLSVEDIWGHGKQIRFHLKEKGAKQSSEPKLRKDRSSFRFQPPNPFSICSYPPEDVAIECFGDFLKKKGTQILIEESARTIPFSTSIEDGLDMRETIRHWHEKKLYVKTRGKPPSGVGSVCIIFDEDKGEEGKIFQEKYSWRTTWIGEHQQESDMAFYATPLANKVVGPGISRCEYGGFMMSYPRAV